MTPEKLKEANSLSEIIKNFKKDIKDIKQDIGILTALLADSQSISACGTFVDISIHTRDQNGIPLVKTRKELSFHNESEAIIALYKNRLSIYEQKLAESESKFDLL